MINKDGDITSCQTFPLSCNTEPLLVQDPIAEEKLEQQQQQLSPGAAGNLVVAAEEEQHEEILANFDSFLKLAGSELISVRDMAKNMTGRGEKIRFKSDHF